MSNFALITCTNEKHQEAIQLNPVPDKNVLSRLISYLKAKFLKYSLPKEDMPKAIELETKTIELYENTSMFIVNIPYDMENIKKRIEKIKESIHNFSRENGIKCIILSDELKSCVEADWSSNAAFNGHTLYLSLVGEILDEICSIKGIKIGDLDITIIHGKSNELFTIVSLLAPMTRYMTILSDRKDELEYEVNRIYDETGLSVSLSTEAKAALKSADVIMNLGDGGCINNSKLNSKALIINFDVSASKSIIKENTIINGVEVILPIKLLQKFDKEILRNFKADSLAEIVLCNKLEYFQSNKEKESEILKSIVREFKKDGFRIAALKGRHNLIRFEQI